LAAVNIAISHPECGIVVIDSLSNLLTEQDLADNALWTSDMGQQAKLISRFTRIMRMRLMTERKLRHPILVIAINQLRTRPGVAFGDPETTSGGHAHRHTYTLMARFEQFAIPKDQQADYMIDKEIMASRHIFKITKFKVPILARSGEFIRTRVDLPEVGLKAGEVRSMNTLLKRAKDTGVLTGKSGSYTIPGVNGIKKLDDLKELLVAKPEYRAQLQADVIAARKRELLHAANV
jgi:recombination protein RecA